MERGWLVGLVAAWALAGAGCADSAEVDPVEPADGAADSFVITSDLAAALAGPLLDADIALGSWSLGSVEEMVEDAGCIDLALASGPSIAATMNGCTARLTGVPISGAVSLWFELDSQLLFVSIDGVQIGPAALQGWAALSAVELTAGQFVVDAMIAQTVDGAQRTLSLYEVGLQVRAGGFTFAGSGHYEGPGADSALDIVDVAWARGDCLPSSGQLAHDGAAVAFLPSTPDDGLVATGETTSLLTSPCGF